ncbi:dipeptide ABC transporter ATP-binding protein [Roseateles chitinivorans]|uniref:dipeptide ABC transporter ATP-binding protein n=1 Tax=Roseateles chitinivorans TaxID=2917965 RepID=UPI003D67F243
MTATLSSPRSPTLPPPAATLLRVRDLSLQAGERRLLFVPELDLAAGEIVGLVGESGSGKSLTALALLGLLPPELSRRGALQLEGRDLGALDEAGWRRVRGARVGLVFQEPMTALNPLMPIGAQIEEALRLHGRGNAAERCAEVDRLLERVGLTSADVDARRYPHELSGGQRQRVAIAIAVACRPRLLIADEPTTALDVRSQAQILDLLRRLVREDGCGLLLITHDLGVVAEMADRLVVLRHGEVQEQGSLLQLLDPPRHPYTRALVEQSRLRPARPRESTPLGEGTAEVAGPHPHPLSQAGEGASPAVIGASGGRGEAVAPLLSLREIVCDYPAADRSFFRPRRRVRAVDRVSLEILPGERVGLVGESGSGKSTLLRTVLGLQRPVSGEVRLAGERFTGAETALRRRVQIVFQDPYGSFDPRWRVERLLAEPLHLLRPALSEVQARERAVHLLEQVGLDAGALRRFPHEFSGGQRQRLAIARALMVKPELLVLDEAVSALDVSLRAQVLALLERLCRERGVATLFVTHDLAVVRAVTDRVLVLQHGRVVEQGATADLFAAPQHAYTQALLAAAPHLDRALAQRTACRRPSPSTQ